MSSPFTARPRRTSSPCPPSWLRARLPGQLPRPGPFGWAAWGKRAVDGRPHTAAPLLSVPTQTHPRDPRGAQPAGEPLHPPLHHLRAGPGPAAEPQVRAASRAGQTGGAGGTVPRRDTSELAAALPGTPEKREAGPVITHLSPTGGPAGASPRVLATFAPHTPRPCGWLSSPDMGPDGGGGGTSVTQQEGHSATVRDECGLRSHAALGSCPPPCSLPASRGSVERVVFTLRLGT